VNVYHLFHKEQTVVQMVDLCEGGDLYSLSVKAPGRRLPPEVIGFYVAELVAAIAYLHTHDILYSELKPWHLLV